MKELLKKAWPFIKKFGLRLIAWASVWARNRLDEILRKEADEVIDEILADGGKK